MSAENPPEPAGTAPAVPPAKAERDALIDLVEGRKTWLPGNHLVTDRGFDPRTQRGDFVYAVNGWRYQVTVEVVW